MGNKLTGAPIGSKVHINLIRAGYRVPILRWLPAAVGCYWSAGEYSIATYAQGQLSGYSLHFQRSEIGDYPTLKAAHEAAELHRSQAPTTTR